MSIFRKAERRKAKLRLAIDGPSGSGKTFSSLLIAKGMVDDWSKIALIDTEQGRGELYEGAAIPGTSDHIGEYLYCRLEAPYTAARYIELITASAEAGAEVLIVDSSSHAWAGEGGVLDQVDAKARAGKGNSFTAWKDGSAEQNKLVDAIVNYPGHIILTIRSKVHHVIETNDKGRQVPVKVGMKPIQRDDLEYEMTACFTMSIEGHYATAHKDNTSLFDSVPHVPSTDTGAKLLSWLNKGADAVSPLEQARRKMAEATSLTELKEIAGEFKDRAKFGGWLEELTDEFGRCAKALPSYAGEEGGAEPPADSQGDSPAPSPQPSTDDDPVSSPAGESVDGITIDDLVAKVRGCVVTKHLDNIEAKYRDYSDQNGFGHVFLAECKARRDELTNTPPAPEAEEVA